MSRGDAKEKAAYIQSLFQQSRNSLQAKSMSAYMKDQFIFYGVKSPERKSIVSVYWRDFKEPPQDELKQVFEILWDDDHRESQYFSMDIMQKIQKKMDPSWLPLLESFILKKSWWDTVDFLASNPIGNILYRYPELIDEYTDRWMGSGNMWLQRTCLIYQLKYKQDLDFKRLKTFIQPLKGSKEFFINKAIGWALRQHSKVDAQSVYTFLEANPDLSNLSKREASKYL